MIRCEAHKDTNEYDIQFRGTQTDIFKETAVLLYAIHQESGIDWEKLFKELETLCLAACEVTQPEGDE